MSSRRQFMETSAIAGAGFTAAQLPQSASAAEGGRYADKLTDAAGKYVAGPLPFAFNALEPVIDARTVELHYNFHHKPAAAAANKAEQALAKARETGDFALVLKYQNKRGDYLAQLFNIVNWDNVSERYEAARA